MNPFLAQLFGGNGLLIVMVIVGIVALVLFSIITRLLQRILDSRADLRRQGEDRRTRGLSGCARCSVGLIVDNRITSVKSGMNLSIDDLSTHYMAGGNVEMVVLALIAARKAGIHLEFDRACAIDLATKGTGKTVLEAVKTSDNPKVIDCPEASSGKVTIDAVAKDGIVIKARARVTVRTNLDRFVGGATEETIIARVGEGIVTTIGSSNSYKDVLENPDRISKTVLD